MVIIGSPTLASAPPTALPSLRNSGFNLSKNYHNRKTYYLYHNPAFQLLEDCVFKRHIFCCCIELLACYTFKSVLFFKNTDWKSAGKQLILKKPSTVHFFPSYCWKKDLHWTHTHVTCFRHRLPCTRFTHTIKLLPWAKYYTHLSSACRASCFSFDCRPASEVSVALNSKQNRKATHPKKTQVL